MDPVKLYCDRVILLEKGVIYSEGDPSKVVNDYQKLQSGNN